MAKAQTKSDDKSSRRKSKTPDAKGSDPDTRKELKKARHIMRHLESKLAKLQEDHQEQLEIIKRHSKNPGGADSVLLERRVRLHACFNQTVASFTC